jgi:hypothetical protein
MMSGPVPTIAVEDSYPRHSPSHQKSVILGAAKDPPSNPCILPLNRRVLFPNHASTKIFQINCTQVLATDSAHFAKGLIPPIGYFCV